jgi:hypothetical protein
MLTLAPANSQPRSESELASLYFRLADQNCRVSGQHDSAAMVRVLAIAKSEVKTGRRIDAVLSADDLPIDYCLADICPDSVLDRAVDVVVDLTAQADCVPDVGEHWPVKVEWAEVDARILSVETIEGRILVVVKFERLWGNG